MLVHPVAHFRQEQMLFFRIAGHARSSRSWWKELVAVFDERLAVLGCDLLDGVCKNFLSLSPASGIASLQLCLYLDRTCVSQQSTLNKTGAAVALASHDETPPPWG